MAKTFFNFDTTLNNGDHLLSPDDDIDCLENEEEEYDALNDETFGALEDTSGLDDWEQQHEQFAEIAESSKHSEHLENSISQLVLDDSDDVPPNYRSSGKNGDVFNSSILSALQRTAKSFTESRVESNKHNDAIKSGLPLPSVSSGTPAVTGQMCTVEELERGLLKNRPKTTPQVTPNVPFPPLFQQHPLQQCRLPPGLSPLNVPPHLRHLSTLPHHNLPPGLVRLVPPPHLLQAAQRPHPGLIYHNNPQLPMNHPMNFPAPPRNAGNQVSHANKPHYQQRVRNDSYRHKNDMNADQNRDEYAGLMTNREKQWLLNIQLLQLNTGTPYFDDYYYTVFKERKAKEAQPNDRNQRYQNRQQRDHHRNNDRQDNSNTLTPRVYTPLQFENSLGKLQCGSVTAPRKIIDMDIVTPEKDPETTPTSRDPRKSRQLLLELEALYTLMLRVEDLNNPLAKSNMEKLREIKQKQRFKELEAAPTSEQKQEILKLIQQESEPVVENEHEHLQKILNGLLQEEKFSSFLNIRKGKTLLLRLLPHLTSDTFSSQLLELWNKVLLSLPMVGRRDTAGDNILPKLHPFFKRYIQTSKMSDVLEIAANLVEVVRLENSRSTPLHIQGKSPLYFVLSNKFGVSALSTMLIRCEYLISSDNVTEKQLNDWSNFVVSWAETTTAVTNVAAPLEPIPPQVYSKHCVRITKLTPDKKIVLQRAFVDSN